MGNRAQQKKTTKSIFKVTGSKTFKAKHKPKPVPIQLKKLNEMTKKKTEDINKQLSELQTEVRNQTKLTEEHKMIVIDNNEKESEKDKLKKFMQTDENTIEALTKLNTLEV